MIFRLLPAGLHPFTSGLQSGVGLLQILESPTPLQFVGVEPKHRRFRRARLVTGLELAAAWRVAIALGKWRPTIFALQRVVGRQYRADAVL